jgi:hypothetical protein
VRSNHLRSFGLVVKKFVYLRGRPVEDRNLVAVIVHVQNQVLAHYRQTDQPDIATSLSHAHSPEAIRLSKATQNQIKIRKDVIRPPVKLWSATRLSIIGGESENWLTASSTIPIAKNGAPP